MMTTKPIVWFDIETTGLNINRDRIIEIYMMKKLGDGTVEELYSRFNPYPIEISKEASKVHRIEIEDLQHEPTFKEKSEEILQFIEGCDLGGYNILNFDLPLLFEEFIRVEKILDYRKMRIFDAYLLWSHYEPRTLEGASKRFLGIPLESSHRAKVDVEATVKIFENQIKEWSIENFDEVSTLTSQLDKKLDILGKFQKSESGEIILTFGKHANKTIQRVFEEDPEYFNWIYQKSEMPSDTKMIARKIYKKFSDSYSII